MMNIPEKLDLLLIGSGPHNLTLASFLLKADPGWKNRLGAVDPSGKWLTEWDRQMAAQEIVHLRSSSVHHPDPDPMALRRFAKGRFDEFYPPYFLPGTSLFRDFCGSLMEEQDLNSRIFASEVTSLRPGEEGFLVELSGGKSLAARAVAFAVGGGRRIYPDFSLPWLGKTESSRLVHSGEVDLRELEEGEESILIVGGGLTAGHLALGALRRGHRVTLVTRRKITYKLFDAAPGWIGPRYLAPFLRERSWAKRRRLIKKARGGGAMTEEIRDLLAPYQDSGQLSVKEGCQVKELTQRDGVWRVDCGWGRVVQASRIWLCTGTTLDLGAIPFLENVRRNYPVELVGGLPILEEDCRWPGLPLYLMGIPSALRVGPAARNLPGARQAASRIASSLTGVKIPAN